MADKKISALDGATTPLAGTEVLPIVQSGSTVKVAVSDLTAGRAVSASSVATTGNITSSTGTIQATTGAVKGVNITGMSTGTTYFVDSGYGTGMVINGATATAPNTINLYNGAVGGVLTMTATGDVNLIQGNLVQGTAAKGVNFTANTPAAGMTSQLLNWYEEGTWTPVVAIGITSPTYATQTGTYTRIGNTVFFKCYLSVNGGTLNGGQITLTGLPFTASGVGASASFGYVGGGAQTLLATSALPILNVSWSGSATTIYYYRTTGANFAGTDLSSSTARWDFSGQYTI